LLRDGQVSAAPRVEVCWLASQNLCFLWKWLLQVIDFAVVELGSKVSQLGFSLVLFSVKARLGSICPVVQLINYDGY
jgi:hypothetical protein